MRAIDGRNWEFSCRRFNPVPAHQVFRFDPGLRQTLCQRWLLSSFFLLVSLSYFIRASLLSETVRGLAITDKLEKIPIRIEEVEAVMIAPVNRRMIGNPAFSEEPRGDCQICVPYPKRVVALAERMMDHRRIGQLTIRLEKERTISISVAQEKLILQPHLDRHAEHLRIERLGTPQVGNIDTEMIQTLEVQHQ